jgi:hypothetical protein
MIIGPPIDRCCTTALRHTGLASLVAEAGGDLPSQFRTARTSVDLIGDEQPGVAKADAAVKAADGVPNVTGSGYAADAPERRAVAARSCQCKTPTVIRRGIHPKIAESGDHIEVAPVALCQGIAPRQGTPDQYSSFCTTRESAASHAAEGLAIRRRRGSGWWWLRATWWEEYRNKSRGGGA